MSVLRRWVGWSLDHPWIAPALCLLLTLVAALGLPRLRLETDGRSLIPPDHPALEAQERVDRSFARSDFLVVAIAGDREIYTPAVLDWIARTSRRLEDLPGVAPGEVRSLSATPVPRWSPAGLHLEPPIAAADGDPAGSEAVRRLAESQRLVHRLLTAADGKGAAIYVAVEPGADRRLLVHRAEQVAREELARLPARERASVRVHLLGPAFAESILGEHVLADLGLLLPLAAAVVALLLWLWFRWWPIVMVGLGEAVVVVTWTLGLMGFASRGITLVAVVMPVILVTYCVADTIHITERFRKLYAAGDESVRAALQRTMNEVVRPVVLTSLTTAAGFLAFAASPIPPLREFGVFSALGLLGALITSLLVVPPVMLLASRHSLPARCHRPLVADRLGAATVAVARRPWAVVLCGLALTTFLGLGWSQVRIQDSWLDNFSDESALVRTDRWFNERFLGSNVLNVVLEPRGGTALDAGFLDLVRRLQRHLEGEEAVGGSISLADQMATVGLALTGEAVLPRSAGEAEEWALLLRIAGGSAVLAPYLDESAGSTCVWVYLNRADSRKTRAVLGAVDEHLRGLGEEAPRASFAGDAFLGLRLVELIARGQWLGVVLAVGLNFVVVLLFLPNLRDALLVVLPVGLAVLWNYGWMGWSGLPLGVATSTFSAISLGIGIDFAIHWHETLKLRLRDTGSWEEGLRATGATSGGAILLNGVVLLCGLGVLFASSVPPNRHLAVLVSVNLLACLVSTLVLLPALSTLLRGWRAPVAPAEAWARNEPGALS